MVDQRRFVNQRLVDAATAARRLGVKLPTLYAYVSRGQLRSVAGARGRPRLYSVDDIERLVARHAARAGHGAVAAGALRWGEPVMDSAITQITPRGPAYRGHLAVALAAAETPFENVAELLWSGALPRDRVRWPRAAFAAAQLARVVPPGAGPLDVMAIAVQLAALADPTRDDPRPDVALASARGLIGLAAACVAPTVAAMTRALGAPSIAEAVVRGLDAPAAAAPVVERTLVLLADHELNASSFAARIAASTEASPHACVAAALATLSGRLHGAASIAVARFLDDVGGPARAKDAVRALHARGELPPGFGHPLYDDGDPRATALLELVERSSVRTVRTALAVIDAVDAIVRRTTTKRAAARPNVDFALAAVIASLGAPASAGASVFATSRAAGWIAHVIEQRAAGYVLRPRARYTGRPLVERPRAPTP